MTTAGITVSGVVFRRLHWFGQTGQITKRWITNTLRMVWGAALSLLQPMIWILLFGQVFSSVGKLPQFGDVGYISFLVPGVLMMTVLYSGAWAGSGYIDDMNSGVMDQFLTAPIARSALITGQLLQQLLVCLAQSVVVLGIGWLAGAHFHGGVGGVAVALAAALTLSTIFCSVSTALALTTKSQIALIGISQMVVLPVTFVSTTMMPSALMPQWVQHVSRYNPMTWSVEIGRNALRGTTDWSSTGLHAAGLILLAALTFLWSVRAIRSYQRSL